MGKHSHLCRHELQTDTDGVCNLTYLQTSLDLEKSDDLMTSGAIQAYVPAALMRVVWYTSRAKPKSVIFSVFPLISSSPITSFFNNTENRENPSRLFLFTEFKCAS